MSDPDSEEIPHSSWLDSESDFPEISSVNSELNLGVNVISSSANTIHEHIEQALGIEDSNAAGSASNKGNPLSHVLVEETESNKGVNLLKVLTPTPPPSKQASITIFVLPLLGRGPWVDGKG